MSGDQPAGDSSPWLVVGLGNPGPEYDSTRHSVGRAVVELLARRRRDRWRVHRRARSDVADTRVGDPAGIRVLLARPRTFMNESGGAVAALVAAYDVSLARLVAVHDELDLPYGSLRIKCGGGDNGHNGLRSVRRSLSSGDFLRVRFGIGRPSGRQDPAEFVLSRFSAGERADLGEHVERAADAVEELVLTGLTAAQNRYHG